jgi:hypothetical protein
MKKLISLFVISFLMLQSCSSGDSSSDSPTNEGLLVKELVVDGGKTFTFTYNGNKITKLAISEDVDSEYTTFSYTGDLITQMKNYDAKNVLDYITDLYYSDNKLIKVTYTSPSGKLESQEDYVYNPNGMVVETLTDYMTGTPIKHSPFKCYYTNGNLVKIEGSTSDITYYTFDTKNSPWKNITGILKISIVFDNFFNTNNPLTETNLLSMNLPNISYSYEYNSQDYPIFSIIKESGETPRTAHYSYY